MKAIVVNAYGDEDVLNCVDVERLEPKADAIAPKPESINFEEAAAIPIGALTAWQAMFDLANLSSGQRILITGASGKVGSMAAKLFCRSEHSQDLRRGVLQRPLRKS
jgi:NADPH-dependent curcumin reductase CurA